MKHRNQGAKHRSPGNDARFYTVLATAFLAFVIVMSIIDGAVNGGVS